MSPEQAKVPGNKFDIIKLDIEGIEKEVLEDAASKKVLCQATCIFMEVQLFAIALAMLCGG